MSCVICDYVSDLGSLGKTSVLCASQPGASCDPNCSPRTAAQLVVFFILIIFPSSLTFQLPYFVILWSPPGGNFCAGYDLKELANHTASLKLEQDVTKGPGPLVSAAWAECVRAGKDYIYTNPNPHDLKGKRSPPKHKASRCGLLGRAKALG